MIFTPVTFATSTTLDRPQGTVLVSIQMLTPIEQIAIPASIFVAAPFNLTPQPLLIAIQP